MKKDKKHSHYVLLDDSPMVRDLWEKVAKASGNIELDMFSDLGSFVKAIEGFDHHTEVYVDEVIREKKCGLALCYMLKNLGFEKVYLYTARPFSSYDLSELKKCADGFCPKVIPWIEPGRIVDFKKDDIKKLPTKKFQIEGLNEESANDICHDLQLAVSGMENLLNYEFRKGTAAFSHLTELQELLESVLYSLYMLLGINKKTVVTSTVVKKEG